jgi:hypothetical protein
MLRPAIAPVLLVMPKNYEFGCSTMPDGTDKTLSVTALGVKTIEHCKKRIRFASLSSLIHSDRKKFKKASEIVSPVL